MILCHNLCTTSRPLRRGGSGHRNSVSFDFLKIEGDLATQAKYFVNNRQSLQSIAAFYGRDMYAIHYMYWTGDRFSRGPLSQDRVHNHWDIL